jgi:phytanoyl-CoA hydroxylase
MLLPGRSDLALDGVLKDFVANGYAKLGRVLSSASAAVLRERADALMLGEIQYPGLFYQHDSESGKYEDLQFGAGWVGPSRNYRKLEKLELDPLFLEWIENPLHRRIAQRLLGKKVSLYRAVLWNKASRAGMDLPWHQDDGVFWGIDRPPSLQIWTALDDAPESAGCVEVLPGSHHKGLASPLGGTVRGDRLSEVDAEAGRVSLPVKAGESILIHNHVWHRSGRNETAQARRAIGIAYLAGDTRCTRKRRSPREFKRVFEECE